MNYSNRGSASRPRRGGSGRHHGRPSQPGWSGQSGRRVNRYSRAQRRALYRRRRIIVASFAVVVVILLIVGIGLLVRALGGSSDKPVPVATSSAASSPQAAENTKEICPASAVKVAADTDKETYSSGEEAHLVMSVTNAHEASCAIQVAPSTQEFRVTHGDETVWSSEWCAVKGKTSDDQKIVFAPNSTRKARLTWQTIPVDKNCNRIAETLPAGKYELVTRLGNISSQPASFTIRDASSTSEPQPTG